MILNNKSENKLVVQNPTDIKQATISNNKWGKLQKLITRGLYEDPQSAVIVELTNNAIDSIITSGKDPIENPVIVSFRKSENNTYELSIKDNGIGMNQWEFDNIFMNYLESTKEEDNTTIGCFGLGGKSPLALKNPYTVISQKDGIKTTYLIWEGKEFTEHTIIHQTDTDETGVEIIVPINNYSDFNSFVHKAKQKLAYYDSVCLIINDKIEDFQIIRNDLFQYSTNNKNETLHFCLKDVYYEIDFSKLNIKPIEAPIALRFDLDSGITPTPSREGIIWDNETIDLFLNRISQVADWFVNKYNEKDLIFENPIELDKYFSSHLRYVKIHDNIEITINSLVSFTNINLQQPRYKGVENTKLHIIRSWLSHLGDTYDLVGMIDDYKYTTKKIGYFNQIKYRTNRTIYYCDKQPSKKIIDYLKSIHTVCYFVTQSTKRKLGYYSRDKFLKNNKQDYVYVLGLRNHPKSEWRKLIIDFNTVEKSLADRFVNINTVIIPNEWIQKNKKKRFSYSKKDKLDCEINFKIARSLQIWSKDKECTFDSHLISTKEFSKRNQVMVYGLESQKDILSQLFRINKNSNQKVQIAMVGVQDYKKLSKISHHNLMTIDSFKSTLGKQIARLVTLQKITTFLSENYKVIECVSTINKVNSDFADKIYRLKNYTNDYSEVDNELMKEMVSFCEKYNYYDYSIYEDYQYVLNNIKNYKFISFFASESRYSYGQIPDEAISLIVEVLKGRKIKLNKKWYQNNSQKNN